MCVSEKKEKKRKKVFGKLIAVCGCEIGELVVLRRANDIGNFCGEIVKKKVLQLDVDDEKWHFVASNLA